MQSVLRVPIFGIVWVRVLTSASHSQLRPLHPRTPQLPHRHKPRPPHAAPAKAVVNRAVVNRVVGPLLVVAVIVATAIVTVTAAAVAVVIVHQ